MTSQTRCINKRINFYQNVQVMTYLFTIYFLLINYLLNTGNQKGFENTFRVKTVVSMLLVERVETHGNVHITSEHFKLLTKESFL